MRRYVGLAVTIYGAIHLLYVAVAKSQPLAAITRDGVFDAVEPHLDREAAFWSLWFGVYVVVTGALIAKRQTEGEPAPALAGWSLVGTGLLGGIMMPFSGFWVAIPLGLLILVPSRRGRLTATA